MRTIFTATFFFLALAIGNLRAETTPEEMIIQYFELFKAGDMKSLAALMHEGELAKFQQTLIPVIEKSMSMDPLRVGRDAAVVQQFMGRDDMEFIRAESPVDFFTRFMTWMMKVNPKMTSMLAGATIDPLGNIPEKDMAHVVYRVNIEMMGARISQLKIISVKKQGDDWRFMLTGEIENMAELMKMNVK